MFALRTANRWCMGIDTYLRCEANNGRLPRLLQVAPRLFVRFFKRIRRTRHSLRMRRRDVSRHSSVSPPFIRVARREAHLCSVLQRSCCEPVAGQWRVLEITKLQESYQDSSVL